jgi:hypothetical protein
MDSAFRFTCTNTKRTITPRVVRPGNLSHRVYHGRHRFTCPLPLSKPGLSPKFREGSVCLTCCPSTCSSGDLLRSSASSCGCPWFAVAAAAVGCASVAVLPARALEAAGCCISTSGLPAGGSDAAAGSCAASATAACCSGGAQRSLRCPAQCCYLQPQAQLGASSTLAAFKPQELVSSEIGIVPVADTARNEHAQKPTASPRTAAASSRRA